MRLPVAITHCSKFQQLSMAPNEPLIIQGYTVLQVKASERSHACHYLYIREHSAIQQCAEWPQGRTVLVYNIPPYCKEENVRQIFHHCGEVLRVYLQPKPSAKPVRKVSTSEHSAKTVQVAYVVFRKAKAVKNVCSLPYDQIKYFSSKEVPVITGLRGYIEEYKQIPDVNAMEKEAETYMAQYYKRKEEEEKKEKEMEGVPDEDGFIKVTRHGKNKGGKRTEENERKGQAHLRNRAKKNELKDFYSFQFRETKRKHIADLQAKFEEDKKRVREMRMSRKFRPF